MTVTYFCTFLFLIFFNIYLLNNIPYEEWPFIWFEIKNSIFIYFYALISISWIFCSSLLPFNHIYAYGSGEPNSLEEAPNAPNPSTAILDTPNTTDSGDITPKPPKREDTSGEETPKGSEFYKLNLEEANRKLK